MGAGIAGGAWELADAIAGVSKADAVERVALAEVVRRDADGTWWVRIAGAETDTPVAVSLADASPGDRVQVRIEGGRATMVGNASAPSTSAAYVDGSVAPVALAAAGAQASADGAQASADEAMQAAAGASASAGRALESSATAKALAQSAEAVSSAISQHFWHDDSGAHVTEVTQDEWNDSAGDSYRSGANSLWNSLGMLFRKGLTNLLAIVTGDATGVAIYDGQGNGDANVVASFTDSQVQLGKDAESHATLDYHSLQLVDKEGNTYFHVSDLRDSTGYATITEAFTGDGTTQLFTTALPIGYVVSATVDGTTTTLYSTYEFGVKFYTAPSDGAEIILIYKSKSELSKAYTAGIRKSGESIGAFSFAEGRLITASGNYSHAEGTTTVASGTYSHAEGGAAKATGSGSHAEGNATKAEGHCSHAEGSSTEARGKQSHTEGFGTIAYKACGHAEGANTKASGAYSHAEGYMTSTTSDCSHAEGDNTAAIGKYSHAQNIGTIAFGEAQTALGKYNVSDKTSALIIGNGTGKTDAERSNAFTIDWNGNTVAAGNVTDGDGNVLSSMLTKAEAADTYLTEEGLGDTFLTREDAADTYAPISHTHAASDIASGTLPVARGGTGGTTAAEARNALNVPYVSDQSAQNVGIIATSNSDSLWALYANVTNASNEAYAGKRVGLWAENGGLRCWCSTDQSAAWRITGLSGTLDLGVATSSPSISNATATRFELRRSGHMVSLTVSGLKVDAALATGSSVSLGSNIIPSAYRPPAEQRIPLCGNNSLGTGCFLVVSTAGTVTLHNRSGASFSTSLSVGGGGTWIAD